jgi:hypothetical protein
MRRGLIHWSHNELPAAALEARVGRLQSTMRSQELAAVLVYASFAQPAPLQWLCNYIPYWADAVLVVWAEGPPSMLVTGTPRTHPWIRSVTHVGELIAAPKLGAQVVEQLGRKLTTQARVGVVALDALPWAVAEPLLAAGWGERLQDATAAYQAARQPGDEAEQGMARKAMAIAEEAIAAVPTDARSTAQVISAIDGAARAAGAEEVLPRVAPDLARDATLRRVEGDLPLGARYAVDASLAYKGVWVRVVRSCMRQGPVPAAWSAAEAWFQDTLRRPRGMEVASGAPGRVDGWTVEASTGLAPLSVVSAQDQAATVQLPAGSLAVFSARLALDDGPWLRSTALQWERGPVAAA